MISAILFYSLHASCVDFHNARKLIFVQHRNILVTVATILNLHIINQFWQVRPTVGVTREWVGRENAILTEPASSHANCLKTRRLPPVGCTLCWVRFLFPQFCND